MIYAGNIDQYISPDLRETIDFTKDYKLYLLGKAGYILNLTPDEETIKACEYIRDECKFFVDVNNWIIYDMAVNILTELKKAGETNGNRNTPITKLSR